MTLTPPPRPDARGEGLRLSLRRKRGDRDPELTIGVLGIPLALCVGFIMTLLPASWIPPCRFRDAVGVPCPTCGAYRSLCLVATGRIGEALRIQPLAVAVLVAALAYAVYSLAVVAARLPRVRLEGIQPVHRRIAVFAAVLLLLVNWLCLILTGAG